MDFFGVLTLIGGLALFLFGMDVMGKSLEKRAGGKLHDILETMTSSTGRGFLLGLCVTAVIQSSSATTVMVVGFVNSGMMKLSQASGVIMGSNVGTTVTSWILSLAGLEGDSLIIRLLKPSSFSPLLALVGIILYMGKNARRKDTGSILLGFAVLMFGMQTMSAAVAPLAGDPNFVRLFTIFSNPILGVLLGALLTALIQSSSASVGILQALAVTGAITYRSAIPIIMGQNIGTCVTALLSSVGANRNARRAAMIHFYFNVIGALVFLILYTVCDAIFHFAFAQTAVTSVGIAVVHTCFNLLTTALLLPFTKMLEKLAYLTIPDGKEEDAVSMLDERLMTTPAMAVAQGRSAAVKMAHRSRAAVLEAVSLMDAYNDKTAQSILDAETAVDRYEDAIGTYLVHLSTRNLTDKDSQDVSVLLHTIGDLERISDHAVNLTESAQEIHEKRIVFSPGAQKELGVLTKAVHEIVDLAINTLETRDLKQAAWVEPLEQVIDELTKEIRSHHIERLQSGECTIQMGFVLSDLLTNYERVADHCSNIALAQIEAERGQYDAHEYASGLIDDPMFKVRYAKYKKRYALDVPADEA